MVVVGGAEVVGAGLSTARGGRRRDWAAAALLRRRWEGEVGPRSFGEERPSSWRVRFGEERARMVAPRSSGGVRQWWRWPAALLGTREGLGSALYRPGRRGRLG